MIYGTTHPLWRAAAGPVWEEYTHHRFVEGVQNGTLPDACFLHYLRQDYVYLMHYAKAWALGVTKADTLEEMRACSATVEGLVNAEMILHVDVCASHGIDQQALFATEERSATMAYTRYVLATGHAGDFLDLMAALAPCVWGYGEIGARLLAQSHAPQYLAWIETYGGAQYQDICHEVGAMIDAAILRRLGPDPQSSPRWPGLCRIFRQASKLEVDFWAMGLQP